MKVVCILNDLISATIINNENFKSPFAMYSKQENITATNIMVWCNLNALNVLSLKVTFHARHVLVVAKISMRLQKGTRCEDRDFCFLPSREIVVYGDIISFSYYDIRLTLQNLCAYFRHLSSVVKQPGD